MGKINIEEVKKIRNTVRTNIGSVTREYKNKSNSIISKMDSVIQSYSEYSDVTSKAKQIRQIATKINSEAIKIEQMNKTLVEGLESVVKLVKEGENEGKQIIRATDKNIHLDKIKNKGSSGSIKSAKGIKTKEGAEKFLKEVFQQAFDNKEALADIDCKSIAEQIKEYGQSGIDAFALFLDELADDKDGTYIKFFAINTKNDFAEIAEDNFDISKLKSGDCFKGSDGSAISNMINDVAKFLNEDDRDIIPSQSKTNKKQINPNVNFYDKKATIVETKEEIKIESSLIDAKVSSKSEYAQGSIQVKAVTGEAHGAVSGGLYVYEKGPDGQTKKVIRPGIAAEIGASVSALDVAAEGRIGVGKENKMLGVYGKGEVKAQSAEASAKVALNGTEVYAGASAEADFVKAEAAGGVSVLGTDIGVSGAVKVGAGAHAEVGFTQGKLKVDVGAAVGVGVDIGFEVDISGSVEAVQGLAESAWDKVKGWVS